MELVRWDEASFGKLNEDNMRRLLEEKGYQVSRYVYPPGSWFPPHQHGVDKIDGVLSGRFEMVMQGKAAVLEAGDMLSVPMGEIHSAKVVGEEPVISLDAIKQPV